jgi:hypothetical protein
MRGGAEKVKISQVRTLKITAHSMGSNMSLGV